jgi:hypothetical protein
MLNVILIFKTVDVFYEHERDNMLRKMNIHMARTTDVYNINIMKSRSKVGQTVRPQNIFSSRHVTRLIL